MATKSACLQVEAVSLADAWQHSEQRPAFGGQDSQILQGLGRANGERLQDLRAAPQVRLVPALRSSNRM